MINERNWMHWLPLMCLRTLQSLGLPGSITALDRPTGLPPALLQKAEEIQAQGGVAKVQALLQEVSRVARANNDILEEVRCLKLARHTKLTALDN
jgi:programmed cell death 6-interacting protein